MNVYLMRHGEAVPETADPARPLSERGRREVERVARAVARLEPKVAAIHHSGKLRARQTAEILARDLRPPRGVSEMAGLAPNDDPERVRPNVDGVTEPLMLVGHLPHLSRLASLLLAGDESKEIVALAPASVVALGRDGEGWRLRWMLTPETARG